MSILPSVSLHATQIISHFSVGQSVASMLLSATQVAGNSALVVLRANSHINNPTELLPFPNVISFRPEQGRKDRVRVFKGHGTSLETRVRKPYQTMIISLSEEAYESQFTFQESISIFISKSNSFGNVKL